MAKKLPVWNVYIKTWSTDSVGLKNVFSCGCFEQIFKELKCIRSEYRKAVKLSDGKSMKKLYGDYEHKMSDKLIRELMYYFWSKCEYEVIIGSWPHGHDVPGATRAIKGLSGDRNWFKDRGNVIQVLDAGRASSDIKVDVYSQIMANYEPFKKVVYEYIKF